MACCVQQAVERLQVKGTPPTRQSQRLQNIGPDIQPTLQKEGQLEWRGKLTAHALHS